MIGAVLVLTGAAPTHVGPVSSARLSIGRTVVEGKAFGGQRAVVQVRVARPPTLWPYKGVLMWGIPDESDPLRSIVVSIHCTVDGEKVEISPSAFMDLANPCEVSLAPGGVDSLLRIRGSDAGGAYEADLIFCERQLARRVVRDREFPDEVWEETRYHWIDPASTR